VTITICRETWKVEAARDGRLEPREKQEFSQHEQSCASCAGERVWLERIALLLRRLPVHKPSPILVNTTRRRLLNTASQLEN
jgi:hypothetical protein